MGRFIYKKCTDIIIFLTVRDGKKIIKNSKQWPKNYSFKILNDFFIYSYCR